MGVVTSLDANHTGIIAYVDARVFSNVSEPAEIVVILLLCGHPCTHQM